MPLRLAAAYGLPRPAAAARTTPAEAPAVPSPTGRAPEGISRLVAARVPQRMDFEVPQALRRPEAGALSMYRHPAERNAAATGVELGRRIDLQG